MPSPDRSPDAQGRWTSLWVAALLSLLGQLWLCQFFSFGERVPLSLDVDPSNLWKYAYHFPPTGSFLVLNWLGVAYLPSPLNPFSFAANLPPWIFFTAYTPVIATLALLAMAAFLRELELPRPAALFGAVVYAWQGDILPFVFPGHYAYITTWPFFALAAWGALRAQRTRQWAYAILSGAACGLMVELQPDRGSIASLLIAALYAAPALSHLASQQSLREHLTDLRHLALCAGMALLIALAAFLALFQSFIVGVKIGGSADREETYKLVTQYSYGPEETLTYLVPGFFGWHTSSQSGPYWGRIGQWPGWEKDHHGQRNLNLAISTTGTVATVLALIGACLLLPGAMGRWPGPGRLTVRQLLYGRLLLALGFVALILAWGWHTPFYRPLFELPLMDKWRNPLKWLEMTNFALVTLSAFGVQHLLLSLDAGASEAKIVRQRLTWFASLVLALLGIGLLVSYPYAIVLAARLQAAGYESYAIGNIMGTLTTSLLWAVILMALFCLLLYALWRPDWLRGFTLENPWLDRLWHRMLQPDALPLTLAMGLAVLGVAQLGWVATQFIRPTDLRALTEMNPLLETLRSEGDTVRVSVATEDPILNVLLQNQFAAAHISSLDISAASRIPDDFGAFLKTLSKDEARLWFLTGVKNVVVPQEFLPQLRHDPRIAANIDHADGYTLEANFSSDLPSHALVVMRDYLAKATLAPHVEVFPNDDALLKRLSDPNWNPRESVLVDPGYKLQRLPDKVDSSVPDGVRLRTYTPHEIEIEVESSRGGYVLINDQYDPDWQVQVNGHDAPLLRANYIMRAVAVPPGVSKITLHYVAHYHVAGLNLPAVAVNNFSDAMMLAAWIVAGVALWWRRELPV